MANGAEEEGEWGFTEHPVVKALVPDPTAVPRLTLFAGLPGNAPGDRRRVYVSPVLDEYLEVDAADLLYTYRWPGDIRHLVWIKEGARVTHVTTREHDAAHQFLAGPITRTFYAEAAADEPRPTSPPPQYPPQYGWPGRAGDYGDWTASNCRTCPSRSP